MGRGKRKAPPLTISTKNRTKATLTPSRGIILVEPAVAKGMPSSRKRETTSLTTGGDEIRTQGVEANQKHVLPPVKDELFHQHEPSTLYQAETNRPKPPALLAGLDKRLLKTIRASIEIARGCRHQQITASILVSCSSAT